MAKVWLVICLVGGLAALLLLGGVFSGEAILPQQIILGPLRIRYYGIFMAAAVLLGYLIAKKRSGDFGINAREAEEYVFWAIAGGFIGARLYHIASEAAYYFANPAKAIMVWEGGLSIYGAVGGGLAAVLLLRARLGRRVPVLRLLDWLAPSLLAGQIVGRLGNFFNYEAYGLPTSLPWKMYVPGQFRLPGMGLEPYYHPWFLYEMAGNLLILVFLLKFQKKEASGSLFFYYLLLYNTLRFMLEFIRADSVILSGIRVNAVASAILAAAALALILRGRMNVKVS